MEELFNFKSLVDKFNDDMAIHIPDRVDIRIPNAEERLRGGLNYYVRRFNMDDSISAEWNETNYRPVVQWMESNHGRGLLMCGGCGLGKTLIGKYILPYIIRDSCRRIVNTYSVSDLAANPDEIMRYHILYIDDVGTETMSNIYGNKRVPFSELVALAEQEGKLLILSTNLNSEDIKEKYGTRTYDRLRYITKYVPFTGKSLRK